MAPTSYRLDTVAAHIVGRLEPTRRSYAGRHEEFEGVARGLVEEELAAVVAEYRELFGDDARTAFLRRELLDTFLPRYLRLARFQTDAEDAWGPWAADPLMRVVASLAAFGLAWLSMRVFRGMYALGPWLVALLVPFGPELRALLLHRRHLRALQAVVDDMGHIEARREVYLPPLPGQDEAPVVKSSPGGQRTPQREPQGH